MYLLLNLAGEFDDFELRGHGEIDFPKPLGHVESIQQLLPIGEFQRQVGGEEVGQGPGTPNAVERLACLIGNVGREADNPVGGMANRVNQCLLLGGDLLGLGIRMHRGQQIAEIG